MKYTYGPKYYIYVNPRYFIEEILKKTHLNLPRRQMLME